MYLESSCVCENPGKSRRKTRKRQSDTVKKYTIINGQDKIGEGGG